MQRLSLFLSIASLLVCRVSAHARIYAVAVNGVDQGNGMGHYIRSPPSTGPIKDVRSSDMRCNVDGDQAVPESVSVKAGDSLTFEWHRISRQDEIIDSSHKGPVLVYMSNSGRSWTKIYQDSFADDQWAVDRLIDARGFHTIVVPDVPAGDYIMRAEIIALHESDAIYSEDTARGAQFYPNCVQIRVTSNGLMELPGGAQFPDHTQYRAPGPAVWSGSAGGAIGKNASSSPPTPTQCSGLEYTGPTECAFDTETCVYDNEWWSQCEPSTTAPVPAPTASVSAGLYEQCGGNEYTGPTQCASGSSCVYDDDEWSQCEPSTTAPGPTSTASVRAGLYEQCGGNGYTGPTQCASGSSCVYEDDEWSQCEPRSTGGSTAPAPVAAIPWGLFLIFFVNQACRLLGL